MSAMSVNGSGLAGNKRSDLFSFDGDMTELSLLLPSWQAAVLESMAQDRGLTTAQMVRRLIRDFFDHLHAFGPANEWESPRSPV